MMGTSKKIGGTVSGEGGAAAEEERVLDPKIAIFKVPPFLNQVEFEHAVFEKVLRKGPKKAIETIWDRNPPRKGKKNVVENGHGCCGIYSTRFAVALVFGRGGTRYRGCWINYCLCENKWCKFIYNLPELFWHAKSGCWSTDSGRCSGERSPRPGPGTWE